LKLLTSRIELEVPGYPLSSNAKYIVSLTKEERDQLERVLEKGKHSRRKIIRAQILLNADQGEFGPAMKDEEIVDKIETSIPTVQRVRKLFVIEGCIDAVLGFKHSNAGRKPKIDGRAEAHLVKLACSEAPEGRERWTLRLLSSKLVELEILEKISHVAVRDALKKMKLSLVRKKNGS
jgi:hypothetical protein